MLEVRNVVITYTILHAVQSSPKAGVPIFEGDGNYTHLTPIGFPFYSDQAAKLTKMGRREGCEKVGKGYG